MKCHPLPVLSECRIPVRCEAFSFLNRYNLVDGKSPDNLLRTARPGDFKRVHLGVRSQAKMDPRILRRAIAHPALGLVVAHEVSCGNLQRRPDSVAIALRSDQAHGEPMVFLACWS